VLVVDYGIWWYVGAVFADGHSRRDSYRIEGMCVWSHTEMLAALDSSLFEKAARIARVLTLSLR
jgi:hypothetical protein